MTDQPKPDASAERMTEAWLELHRGYAETHKRVSSDVAITLFNELAAARAEVEQLQTHATASYASAARYKRQRDEARAEIARLTPCCDLLECPSHGFVDD